VSACTQSEAAHSACADLLHNQARAAIVHRWCVDNR
jgi:hypothetical protein